MNLRLVNACVRCMIICAMVILSASASRGSLVKLEGVTDGTGRMVIAFGRYEESIFLTPEAPAELSAHIFVQDYETNDIETRIPVFRVDVPSASYTTEFEYDVAGTLQHYSFELTHSDFHIELFQRNYSDALRHQNGDISMDRRMTLREFTSPHFEWIITHLGTGESMSRIVDEPGYTVGVNDSFYPLLMTNVDLPQSATISLRDVQTGMVFWSEDGFTLHGVDFQGITLGVNGFHNFAPLQLTVPEPPSAAIACVGIALCALLVRKLPRSSKT